MIARQLATYIVAERDRYLPDEAWHGARRCFVDWVAATVPGSNLAPATVLAAALNDEIEEGTPHAATQYRAELLPGHARSGARTAALINAAASHTVEFDDIYRDGVYHPGSPVISAALAIAQSRGQTGAQFLRAVISGYEVSNRIAAIVNPVHYRYWHTTATVGTFGAAAASASLLDLDIGATRHAILNAATLAAGLQQSFLSESMSKPLHVGNAAANGVLVSLAAAHGLSGAREMLEGDLGFGEAMCGGPDWAAVSTGLGEDYTIARITHKSHGCCGHAFAAIDAALAIRRDHPFGLDEIERIVVATYGAAVKITSNSTPKTPMEARFSMAYVVAAALKFGAVRLTAFEAKNLIDPELTSLALRVELKIDPELDAAFPKRRSARVEIATKDGQTYKHYAPHRRGDPEQPLADNEIDGKLRELVASAIDDVDTFSSALWSIGERQNLQGLFAERVADVRPVSAGRPAPGQRT